MASTGIRSLIWRFLGEGTGLGLSIAYGIVHGHDGEIWVESVSQKGTTVHIELPGDPADNAPAADSASRDEFSGRPRRILVVNNEPAFRELLTITLSADGHTVDRANDGEDAWNMLHQEDYDRILVNLWMPRMGGQKLCEMIYDYIHDLARKCIFITGITAGDEIQEFITATGNPWLSKPFQLAEIRRLVLDPLRPN